LRFSGNPPQLNQAFSEILSNAIVVFRKSAAPGPGIFREKPYNPVSLRQKTAMIICGTGVLEVDARPIFFGNARHLHRSFSKILNNVIEVFRKSSATQSGFLENSQQVTRIFFKNPQPVTRGFPEKSENIQNTRWGLSPPYPHE
jgi:hypothetical protein